MNAFRYAVHWCQILNVLFNASTNDFMKEKRKWVKLRRWEAKGIKWQFVTLSWIINDSYWNQVDIANSSLNIDFVIILILTIELFVLKWDYVLFCCYEGNNAYFMNMKKRFFSYFVSCISMLDWMKSELETDGGIYHLCGEFSTIWNVLNNPIWTALTGIKC